jgi:hypothetical protein
MLILSVAFFISIIWSNLVAQQAKSVTEVYRVYCGSVNGFEIWIIDGKIVRETVIPEFLYGGNHERYSCVPADEIWLDDFQLKLDHERQLDKVLPTDFYNNTEILRISDSVQLQNIYRVYVGKRDSIDIWIIDGSNIRRDIYPDFGLSGNDRAYHFIPAKEIWLDSQISCEEMEFSIRFELAERKLIIGGMTYDDAYEKALTFIRSQRIELSKKALKIPPIRLQEGKQ